MTLETAKDNASKCTIHRSVESNYCHREKSLRVLKPCGHGNITQVCDIYPFKKHNDTDCYDRFVSTCRVHSFDHKKNQENTCILTKRAVIEWCVCEDIYKSDGSKKKWYECECFHNYWFYPYNALKKHEKAKDCNCDCEQIYKKKCKLYDDDGYLQWRWIPCKILDNSYNMDFKFNCSKNPITKYHPNRTIIPCEMDGVNTTKIPNEIQLEPVSTSSPMNAMTVSPMNYIPTSPNGVTTLNDSALFPKTEVVSSNTGSGAAISLICIPFLLIVFLGVILFKKKKSRSIPYTPVLRFNIDEEEEEAQSRTSLGARVSFNTKRHKPWNVKQAYPSQKEERSPLLQQDECDFSDSDDALLSDL